MRIVGIALVIATFACGAASAQRAPPNDGRFHAEWEERPTNFARYYPQAAMDRETPGMATICCVPRADRRLDCRVAEEFPTGLGFGEATLRTAGDLKMTRQSYAAFQAEPGNWMQMTMRWVLPETPGGDSITQREETLGLCRPDGPATPIG